MSYELNLECSHSGGLGWKNSAQNGVERRLYFQPNSSRHARPHKLSYLDGFPILCCEACAGSFEFCYRPEVVEDVKVAG